MVFIMVLNCKQTNSLKPNLLDVDEMLIGQQG